MRPFIVLYRDEIRKLIDQPVPTELRRTLCYTPELGDPVSFDASETPEGLTRKLQRFGMLGCGPFGDVGTILWVRETFQTKVLGCPWGYSYRADHRDPLGDGPAHPMKWRPATQMPKSISRLSIKTLSLRLDRSTSPLSTQWEWVAMVEGIKTQPRCP